MGLSVATVAGCGQQRNAEFCQPRSATSAMCGVGTGLLFGKGHLKGRTGFGAGNICCQHWIIAHQQRRRRPAQHADHHDVTRAEIAFQPVLVAQSSGQTVQPLPQPRLQYWQALRCPRLVTFQQHGHFAFDNHRFDGADSGEHPGDGAGAGGGFDGQ